jgi:hypothetical protein
VDEKRFLIVKHGHSFLFLFLFLVNLSIRRLFLMYVHYEALAGADSEVGFDPFTLNWKMANAAVLSLNLAAAAGILASFWMTDIYPRFWPFFSLVFALNVFYPSGVMMAYMTGFHFILLSIMLINSYGFFSLLFLRKKWGLVQPVNPDIGAENNE